MRQYFLHHSEIALLVQACTVRHKQLEITEVETVDVLKPHNGIIQAASDWTNHLKVTGSSTQDSVPPVTSDWDIKSLCMDVLAGDQMTLVAHVGFTSESSRVRVPSTRVPPRVHSKNVGLFL